MIGLATQYGIDVRPPPAWTPSGHSAPTPGTPTLISLTIDVFDYPSFPSMVVDSAGTLHLAYRKGSDHNTTANADIVYRTKPLGGVWSGETPAVAQSEHPGLVVTDAALHVLPNGDLLLMYHTVVVATDTRVIYSKVRSGGVWGAGVAFTSDFGSGQVTNGGFSITTGGYLYHPVYARPASSGLRGIYLYRASVAAPTAWTQYAKVCDPGYLNLDYEEPSLVQRPDRSVLAFIRDDNTKKIYRSLSPDLLRWSVPTLVFDGWSKPFVGQNPAGDMLCISRHPSTNRSTWTFSADQGYSWTAPAYIDALAGLNIYGATCWDGQKWVSVYAVETGTNVADIYEVTFT